MVVCEKIFLEAKINSQYIYLKNNTTQLYFIQGDPNYIGYKIWFHTRQLGVWKGGGGSKTFHWWEKCKHQMLAQ